MTHQPGLPAYDDPRRFPARVWQAVELSRANGFPLACIPEVGRLLQIFARGAGRICELGTAYGVGTAWIESGMRSGATLLTVELDPARASAASAVFAENPAIEVIGGDWSLALERDPFNMLFSDSGVKRATGDPEKLLPLLVVGGLIVLDDFSPGYRQDEPARMVWFENPNYRAVEVPLTLDASVLLATKRAAAVPAGRRESRSARARG